MEAVDEALRGAEADALSLQSQMNDRLDYLIEFHGLASTNNKPSDEEKLAK